MCDFVRGTMSHAYMFLVQLHWSVIHHQKTFEWHSGCGSQTSIISFSVRPSTLSDKMIL